jgi:carbon storage regulator CsrA
MTNPPPECGLAETERSAVLILTTKLGQAVRIGDDVRVVLMEVRDKQVRLGIEAPDHVQLCRVQLSDEERAQYGLGPDGEVAAEV